METQGYPRTYSGIAEGKFLVVSGFYFNAFPYICNSNPNISKFTQGRENKYHGKSTYLPKEKLKKF